MCVWRILLSLAEGGLTWVFEVDQQIVTQTKHTRNSLSYYITTSLGQCTLPYCLLTVRKGRIFLRHSGLPLCKVASLTLQRSFPLDDSYTDFVRVSLQIHRSDMYKQINSKDVYLTYFLYMKIHAGIPVNSLRNWNFLKGVNILLSMKYH